MNQEVGVALTDADNGTTGNRAEGNDLRADKDGIETYLSSGNDSAGIAIGDGSLDNTVSAT